MLTVGRATILLFSMVTWQSLGAVANAQSKIPKSRAEVIVDSDVRASVAMLYSSNPLERCQGLRELYTLASRSSAASPWIIEALGDDAIEGDWDPADHVYEVAQTVLQKMGPAGQDALIGAIEEKAVPIRERAAQLLGHINCHRATAPMLKLIQRKDMREVWGTAEALGKLEVDAAVPHLCLRLQSDDYKTRHAAAIALGRIGNPHAVQALSDFVRRNPGTEATESAVGALHEIDGIGFDAAVQLLEDPRRGVRESAARQLAYRRDARLIQPLLDRLDDEYHHVQGSAAQALHWIVELEGIEPIERAFAMKDAYHEVRRVAIVELDRRHPDPIEFLKEALTDRSRDVQETVAKMLRSKPDRRAANALIDAMKNSKSNGVRTDAAAALGILGDKQFVDPLLIALADETSLTRAAAANALGQIGDPRAIAPLIQRLQDPGWDTRQSAALALAEFDDPRVVPALTPMMRHPESSDRTAAVQALARVRQPIVLKTLVDALRDRDHYVCDAARRALVTRPEPDIDKMLEEALEQDDNRLREIVRQILAERRSRVSNP